MKRFITIITIIMLAIGSAMSQPRFSPDVAEVDLGKVEWKQSTNVQYIITNTGDAPLVLTEVEPDCSCTVANWTETPIAPGEEGTIELTFDAETLGHFQKSVTVWTNSEPHIVSLSFKGQVLPEIKDYTASHPYQIGEVRLNAAQIDFGKVSLGELPVFRLSVANVSQEDYEPVLMHLPQYLTMTAASDVLASEEKCDVDVTLDSRLLPDYGLTRTSVYLSRFMGDEVSEENAIPVSVVLLPDFSHLSESDRRNSGHIDISATEIDMSDVLLVKNKAWQNLIIANLGNSVLKIEKLQVLNSAISADIKTATIPPGGMTRLRISVNKKHIKQQDQMRLLLICNDPDNPLVVVDIKTEK